MEITRTLLHSSCSKLPFQTPFLHFQSQVVASSFSSRREITKTSSIPIISRTHFRKPIAASCSASDGSNSSQFFPYPFFYIIFLGFSIFPRIYDLCFHACQVFDNCFCSGVGQFDLICNYLILISTGVGSATKVSVADPSVALKVRSLILLETIRFDKTWKPMPINKAKIWFSLFLSFNFL